MEALPHLYTNNIIFAAPLFKGKEDKGSEEQGREGSQRNGTGLPSSQQEDIINRNSVVLIEGT